MNRGRRGHPLFADKGDYEQFIQLLKETTETWNLRIAAFCLMRNHYHLLVQTPDGNLMNKYSSVSSVIERVKALLVKDRRLKDTVETLVLRLSKSQE